MGRTPCSHKRGLKKGTWTPEEDNKLVSYITKYGHWNWRQLPKFAGLDRCGKSCRLRWMNYLRPGINRGNYTEEEEEIIDKLHSTFGNRWSLIASHLPGRSDNGIKNHWHAHLKKRFQHTSVTTNDENVTDEASKSKHHQSPVESIQQKDLGEIGDPFQNINSPATCQIPDDSPISSSLQTPLSDIFCTAPLISDENSVLDDLANFLDTDTDPISAYSWTGLYAADISYFPNELLAPFLSEPESFSTVYDAHLWGLSE